MVTVCVSCCTPTPSPLCSSLRNELLEQGSLKEADASALVDEVLQDTDLAKYFDEEFEVSTSNLTIVVSGFV